MATFCFYPSNSSLGLLSGVPQQPQISLVWENLLPWGGAGVTGEQAKSNILSEVSFFLSCQNKTKNSKSYTSYKNKRPKILSNLHFWGKPQK